MWRIDTYWFDVAMTMTVLMVGHLFFGRFVEHRSRWRRLLKSLLGAAIIIGVSVWVGRLTAAPRTCGYLTLAGVMMMFRYSIGPWSPWSNSGPGSPSLLSSAPPVGPGMT